MSCSPGNLRPPIASSAGAELWLGIETEGEAENRNEQRADKLWRRAPKVARKLVSCDGDSRSCQLPICAVCARRYRIYCYLQLREIATEYEGPHMIATIHLKHLPARQLRTVNLKHTHDFLRKRFDRAGLKGATFIGGTEANWQVKHQRWLLHVHLLAVGMTEADWDRLDEAWVDSGTEDPIMTEELRDLGEQLSYLVKFHTYHRPGQSLANRRAPAYALPDDRLAELATWSSQYRLDDFLFLYGARRRGNNIVVS